MLAKKREKEYTDYPAGKIQRRI